MSQNVSEHRPKVFVSHSSKDKPFVRRLVDELKQRNVHVWFDERELQVGDSIVHGISTGLNDADYLLVILSKNSVASHWVQSELNAAMMEQTSQRGIVVLPAVIDDCQIPILLRDRIYADFRADFDTGLNALLRVFAQEEETAQSSEPAHKAAFAASDCRTTLAALKLAELRQRMTKRMNRGEIGTIWFDVLESGMDDDMQGRTLAECVVELLLRTRNRNRLADLISSICNDRSDLANP
jgi:hypothetical protein